MKIFFLFCFLMILSESNPLSDKILVEIEKFTSFLNDMHRREPNKTIVPGAIFINSKFDSANGSFLLTQQLILQHIDLDLIDTTNYNYYTLLNNWTLFLDDTTARFINSYVELESFQSESRNVLFNKLLYNPERKPWNSVHYDRYRLIARIGRDSVVRKLDYGTFKFRKQYKWEDLKKMK